MKGFLIGSLLGAAVTAGLGASQNTAIESSSHKPLEHIFVRGLTVVDDTGMPRIILPNPPSASISVKNTRGKPRPRAGLIADGDRVVAYADNIPR